MMEDTLIGLAAENELEAIKHILEPCLKGTDHSPHMPTYTERDLDRADADDTLRVLVDTLDLNTAGTDGLAALLAFNQEEQRIRRDVKIMRMGHKRMMLGCLETLYRRQLKLVKNLGKDNGD